MSSFVGSAQRVIWPNVPQDILARFAELTDYPSSKSILAGFTSIGGLHSFFSLARSVSHDFNKTFTDPEVSFFFNVERGVCLGSADSKVPACPRRVWAAVQLLQEFLTPELRAIATDSGLDMSQSDASDLSDILYGLTMPLVYLQCTSVGVPTSIALVEGVVAASQRLRLRINQLFPELAETSYTWFLPDEDVACILKHVKKVKLDLGAPLAIPFDSDSRESEWLISLIPQSAYPRSRPKPRPSAGLGSSTEIAAFKARLVAKTTPASLASTLFVGPPSVANGSVLGKRSRSRSVQSSAPMVAEDDDVAEFDELDASPKILSAKRRKLVSPVLSSSARSKIPVNAKVTRSMSKKFANKQLLNSTSVVDSGSEDEHDGSDDSLATAVLRVGPPKGKSTAKSSGKKFSKAPPTRLLMLFRLRRLFFSLMSTKDVLVPFLPRSVLKEVISPSYVPTSAQATDPNVWTFDRELLLLANAVALNVGTHSVTFAEFMAAARTTFQIDPRALACLQCYLRDMLDTCDYAQDRKGKRKMSGRCKNCVDKHCTCSDNLSVPELVAAKDRMALFTQDSPLNLQKQMDSIIRAQKAREQSIALCESLTDNLLQEFQLLRSQVTSPAVFMQAILRTHPSKPISLVEWAFLTSLFGWDSPTTFDTTAEFEQFIGSITRAAVVESEDLQDAELPSPSLLPHEVEEDIRKTQGSAGTGSPLSPTTSFPATLPALDLEVVPWRAGGSAASGSGSTTV
ncbi:hypothetical protein BDP27DRAFT_1422831 [Rhodocollybia butyracea]|uniref:Uncharacterized protein n=1 Tax=Rhodocollybia butyracea TaxID=206335 RepID=A0A9P5U591_9AGAR|nr:hypothetical protein BDP27DRAFT_1422831 [Rhodocollybia butyracea]